MRLYDPTKLSGLHANTAKSAECFESSVPMFSTYSKYLDDLMFSTLTAEDALRIMHQGVS